MTDDDDSDLTTAMTDALAEKAAVEAELAALRVRIARGELVDRYKLEAHYRTIALRVRDALLLAPARHAGTLAAEFGIEATVIGAVLDGQMRALLTALAGEAVAGQASAKGEKYRAAG